MSTEQLPPLDTAPKDAQTLNKRLETISWGLFLVMFGGLKLVPASIVPEGAWLLGAGLIMLGLNLARYLNAIPISGFTTVLGVIALASGIGSIAHLSVPVFPLLLIPVGASLILGPLFERRRP